MTLFCLFVHFLEQSQIIEAVGSKGSWNLRSEAGSSKGVLEVNPGMDPRDGPRGRAGISSERSSSDSHRSGHSVPTVSMILDPAQKCEKSHFWSESPGLKPQKRNKLGSFWTSFWTDLDFLGSCSGSSPELLFTEPD